MKTDSFSSKLDRWTMNLAIALFTISTVFIVIQVVTRYVLAFSFSWVEELSRYLVIYMVFLGAGIVYKKDEHPRVEIIYDLLPPKVKYWINYLFHLLIMLFLAVLTWQGIEACIFAWNDYTPALRVRMAIPYFAIPLGGLLMMMQSIILIINNYQKGKNLKRGR